MRDVVKVRMRRPGGAATAHSRHLTVPVLARQIPDETEFLPELTEDGLLYRVVSAPTAPDPRPTWIKNGREETQ